MGVDLVGTDGRRWHFSNWGWYKVLDLAELYGWTPEGTAPPEEHPPNAEAWSGGYSTNDYQRVTAGDAGALAAALGQALADLPAVAARHKLQIAIPFIGTLCVSDPDAPPATPLELFAGADGKRYLEEFIEFCRGGEFLIG